MELKITATTKPIKQQRPEREEAELLREKIKTSVMLHQNMEVAVPATEIKRIRAKLYRLAQGLGYGIQTSVDANGITFRATEHKLGQEPKVPATTQIVPNSPPVAYEGRLNM